MEVEINPKFDERVPREVAEIVDYLILNPEISFKSQQRGEHDLLASEKKDIGLEIFRRSKIQFLMRFGHFFTDEHLRYYKKYADHGSEIELCLNNLGKCSSKQKEQRNRRYEALKKLIDGNTYFSESEMMKRNPLLYDQLVGQYLSLEERRERDKAGLNDTLVTILMEGIERDNARDVQKQQEEAESNAMEEEDDSSDDGDTQQHPQPATSTRWGEFSSMPDNRINKEEFYPKKQAANFITATERALLRDEFTTLMHQSFLDGKDEEFDYSTVDDNEAYDNIDIVNHDAEEKYFDSEEPEDAVDADKLEESSEDELDIYMNALSQHPAVTALSHELTKL